ncbi:MAG: hypothetical protein JW936_11865 [Sedimentisphaerales bacterium]|nr:hypothetical protein [Sedimentisphaerales bacterium]
MIKKNLIMCIAAVLMFCPLVRGEIVYYCGFEAVEGFQLGEIRYQGDPSWDCYYFADAISGNVVDTDAEQGTQCLHTEGYRTSYVQLDQVTRAEWLEFAFKPNFDGLSSSSGAWIATTRGVYYDMVGFTMKLTVGTGRITIDGYPGTPTVDIGTFVNNEWQTISFRHRTYMYGGILYYSGTIDVFLGTDYVKTIETGNTNNGLGTVVFSSAMTRNDWVNTGNLFIDSIYIGDEPVLAAFPSECGDRGTVYFPGDISGPIGAPDCYVDMYDLAVLAQQWLEAN